MSETGRRMWTQAMEMIGEAERLHRQFFDIGRRARPCWEPPLDIFESGEELWLYYALPGVQPEAVRVVLDGEVLEVSGERQLPSQARRGAIRRLEIPYGPFERRVALPSGRYRLIRNEFDAGCLIIGLSRVSE